MNKVEVLYEDNHLIAVNKSPSDIVQGDKTGDEPLTERVKEWIKQKHNKPGNVFLGVIHRLDRPVSGVLLYAKTSKGLERFNELFRTKTITKTYWAIVKNKPAKTEDRLIHYLVKKGDTNFTKAYIKPIPNSKEAILNYRIALTLDNYYLLEINLETGRSHQIRSQLAAIGCPIKGDLKYGSPRSNENKSIHLHARSIEFIHPVSKEPVSIIAKPPSDAIWNEVLKRIELK